MKINVFSEIAPLKNVIIHSPIGEHRFLKQINTIEYLNNKENPDFLLFDDLVDSNYLVKEHKKLKFILDKFTRTKTITFQQLLIDILDSDFIRSKIITEILDSESVLYDNKISESIFKSLTSEQISIIFITGIYKNKPIFKYPLPNLIFTRDIGAVIGNSLLTTWSWHKSRQRESILTKYIVKNHVIFKNINIFNFNKHFPNLSIEGGDITIFSNKIVCIGISQRTSLESIKALLPTIFKNNFKYVYAIELPKERKFMHLDCVFTKINVNECLVYPPLFINNKIKYKIHRFNSKLECNVIDSNDISLLNTFQNDGYNLKFIGCGGKSQKYQDKELLTMGANVFTLRPGVAVGYFRNKETLNELKKFNYNIISSDEFCESGKLLDDEKYFIYIDENELSRGHGGIRCLTFPIERDCINE